VGGSHGYSWDEAECPQDDAGPCPLPPPPPGEWPAQLSLFTQLGSIETTISCICGPEDLCVCLSMYCCRFNDNDDDSLSYIDSWIKYVLC
jgi:hypothetical protein